MLVLTRKPCERLLIGDDVVVTIVRIGPNSVRLGIEAPKTVNIVREELILGPMLPAPPTPVVAPAVVEPESFLFFPSDALCGTLRSRHGLVLADAKGGAV